jgi:hypothetical protein
MGGAKVVTYQRLTEDGSAQIAPLTNICRAEETMGHAIAAELRLAQYG